MPDFKKADFTSMKRTISGIDWETLLINKTAEESWNVFNDKLHEAMDACIPKKRRRNSSRPLWMNQNVMRVIRKKRRMWKWYCQTKDYEDYLCYQNICSSASKTV